MKIPTIESRASNISMDKGNYACCHKVRPIKIFVEYVGPNMGIQVPLLVIDWRGVSHVYIVLKPVGFACLTFVDDIVLYELYDLVTEFCSESRMRSRTCRGVSKWLRGKNSYIGRWYSDTGSVSECTG